MRTLIRTFTYKKDIVSMNILCRWKMFRKTYQYDTGCVVLTCSAQRLHNHTLDTCVASHAYGDNEHDGPTLRML